MTPYKILFITTISELGGGETNLISLVTNLDANRFSPLVICPGRGLLKQELMKHDVRVHTMEMGGFNSYAGFIPRIPLKSMWQLLSFVKQQEIDLIDAHHYEALKLSGPVARIAGIPCIWTCGGFYALRRAKGVFINAIVDRIIADSEFVKHSLISQGTIDLLKLRVVYDIIAPEFWERDFDPVSVRQEFGIPSGAFLVGVVGRIDPEKGHKDFLYAFKQVVDQEPRAKALVVGKGFSGLTAYQEEVECLVDELGISKHVTFAGFRRDMTRVYDALDLLVLPSKREALSLAVIEAMARGKPVVATNCGGPSETLGDNKYGLLVPPGDPSELARAILRMMRDDELRHCLAEAGRRRVERDFATEELVRGYERIYLELLNRRRQA